MKNSFVLLSVFLISADAFAGNVIVDLTAGAAAIEISDVDVYGDIAGDHGGMSYGAFAGYQFDAGFHAAIGVGKYSADMFEGLFDSVDVDTVEAMVGYTFRFNRFFVRPAVGLARWDVNAEAGQFFGLITEDYAVEDTGTDASVSVAVGYDFYDSFGMSIGYWMLDVPFGKLDARYLGLNFRF